MKNRNWLLKSFSTNLMKAKERKKKGEHMLKSLSLRKREFICQFFCWVIVSLRPKQV